MTSRTESEQAELDRELALERNPAARYGQFYWLVETPKTLSYYFADEVRVTDAGDLILVCKDAPFVNTALARGSWISVSAASCMDGGEVALQHSGLRRVS